MSAPPQSFTLGSLYLAGFAQAGAPHAGLIIPTSASSGRLVHIRIDRANAPTWTVQSRDQRIAGEMLLSSLLKLRDVSRGEVTIEQLEEAAASVPPPANDEFGECLPWALRTVQKLDEMGLVKLTDADELGKEFETFAVGNKAYATRRKFPNVQVSEFCS
ncbi:hypothetical protein JB92DRAFT_2723839 [Gautieria morchelliformis]|nr:hypothetical protein JB92DRAFT_2723839 [Gautieria morchelliformis]